MALQMWICSHSSVFHIADSDISINGNWNRNGNGNFFWTEMESKNGNYYERELEIGMETVSQEWN